MTTKTIKIGKLEKQTIRFFKTGCKQGNFTNLLYEAMHLNCGFIAHFDRDGFYRARFSDPESMRHTFDVLINNRANSDPHKILQIYAKANIHNIESAMQVIALDSLKSKVDGLKGGFAFITNNNTRKEAWRYLKAMETELKKRRVA